MATCAVALCLLAVSGCSGSDSGAELKYGESANVTTEKAGSYDVAVLRVEQGKNSDLDVFKDTSRYAGKTPYYVHYRITKTEDRQKVPAPYFGAYAGDKQLTALNVMPSFDFSDPLAPVVQEFDKCTGFDSADFKKAAKGQSFKGCDIYLAESGTGAPTDIRLLPDKIGDDPLVIWK
ncbi:hypothetical protein [Streptomyces sp. NPDC000410]|uniref:hypothetical protein n=1 Tax=Streptomyces sp. NPDC000410 TaxID=3154254 RepID=UPI00332E8276